LGQISGTGERVLNQKTQDALWLAAGITALPEVAVTPWLSLEVEGDLRVLGPDERFTFRPDAVVYDMRRFSWSAGLGVSIRPY
jgi:hypothetical protein